MKGVLDKIHSYEILVLKIFGIFTLILLLACGFLDVAFFEIHRLTETYHSLFASKPTPPPPPNQSDDPTGNTRIVINTVPETKYPN
jgi:hypothetical protein